MSTSDDFLLAVALLALLVAAFATRQARRAVAEALRAAEERARLLAGEREAESALAVARDQLDALGEAALDGLLLLGEDRRIRWGNAAAWELFKAGRPMPGAPFIALPHDAELNQAVVDALSERRPIVRQAAVDGRTLRIRTVPLGETGGVAVAVEDVTELQRLGRARRDLVANISHELRTPLASIGLAAQTLRDAGQGDPALAGRMLDQIEGYVQTLSQLSQEMMDLAQIESGRVLLRMVPVPVEPLLRRAVDLLRPQAEIKGQSMALNVPPELVALADEQQVTRVIANLVHNAVKFTPEGGAIQVSACACPGPEGTDDVKVCVQDNGPGIPATEQARVFERFYKADSARSRGGTGLGLAIARHIVEGHGGRIWVESAPVRGARFCFTLPRT